MPLAAYTNGTVVFATVAPRLYQMNATLAVAASHWTPFCNHAADLSNGTIHRTLLAKSYTPMLLLNDPSIPPLALEIAVYFAMLMGADTAGYSLESIKIKGDLFLKQLEDFPAYNDTQVQVPDGPSLVNVGTIDQRTEVTFTWS